MVIKENVTNQVIRKEGWVEGERNQSSHTGWVRGTDITNLEKRLNGGSL